MLFMLWYSEKDARINKYLIENILQKATDMSGYSEIILLTICIISVRLV